MPGETTARPLPRPVRAPDEADTILRLLMQPENGAELLEELLNRPAWHARAACRGMGTQIFFPTDQLTLMKASRICHGCVVRSDCEDFALAHPSLKGIWAGMSERRRARTRKDALSGSGRLEERDDGRDARGAHDRPAGCAGGVGRR
jgi:WhiB family redox-sensing transcriptional regulator